MEKIFAQHWERREKKVFEEARRKEKNIWVRKSCHGLKRSLEDEGEERQDSEFSRRERANICLLVDLEKDYSEGYCEPDQVQDLASCTVSHLASSRLYAGVFTEWDSPFIQPLGNYPVGVMLCCHWTLVFIS